MFSTLYEEITKHHFQIDSQVNKAAYDRVMKYIKQRC